MFGPGKNMKQAPKQMRPVYHNAPLYSTPTYRHRRARATPILFVLLVFAVMVVPGLAPAQEVTTPIRIGSSEGNRPTLGIPRWKGYMDEANPNNFWISHSTFSSSAGSLRYTTDGGQTWNSGDVQIDELGYMDMHLSMFGKNGELYFTWPGVDFRKFYAPARSESDRGPLEELTGTTSGHRSNVMVDDNDRIWVFTRDGDNSSANVRYQYSDNDGASWVTGVAWPTSTPNVRIGSMPYVNGQAALVVLHLESDKGYEYYLWNGSEFEAPPDHSIYADNVGYSRSFSHNQIGGSVMHLVFGLGNNLHHVWKEYNGGQGSWNHEVIESSPFTEDMDWSPATTVQGSDLYLFYSEKSSSSEASSQIYYKKWSQLSESWTAPVRVSTGPADSYNFDPNTCFQVPAASDYIPVFWHTGTGEADIYFAKILVEAGNPDTTPPATITDLTTQPGGSHGDLRLTWTAPGDDGMSGRAAQYRIRYATEPITANNWSHSPELDSPPTPAQAGQQETATITGLTPGATYYAAVRALDEVQNLSSVSNSPSGYAAGILTPSPLSSQADTIAGELAVAAQTVNSYYSLDYQFALDETSTFSSPVFAFGQIDGGAVIASFDGLTIGRQYYWRVRAVAAGGADSSAWSPATVVSMGTCCVGMTGNINNDPDEDVDLSDAIRLANTLFLGGPPLDCPDEANTNGDQAGDIDLADLLYLVNYLFLGGPAPDICPGN
ncbi:hypothetical protein GF420_03570 [candidate division GN15 bacterium]|nr:hypothetical protein [candidate division GN15 bacterium]